MNIYEYMNVRKNEKPLDRIVTDGGFCSIFRSIACIGDSLASGEFESIADNGEKRYHDFYEYSWGQFIGRSCGSTVYNFSAGGMTAERYIKGFADVKGFWGRDKLCQAYIIALGVNDIINQNQPIGSLDDIVFEDYTKNTATFAGYYAQIIQRIQILQPRAKIFLVSMPKSGADTDEIRKRHRDFLYGLTKVFKNTYLIDLYTYAPINDESYRKTFWLGHLTPMGYVLTARMIESYIDYLIRENPEEFSEVGFIGTDLYYKKDK